MFNTQSSNKNIKLLYNLEINLKPKNCVTHELETFLEIILKLNRGLKATII